MWSADTILTIGKASDMLYAVYEWIICIKIRYLQEMQQNKENVKLVAFISIN